MAVSGYVFKYTDTTDPEAPNPIQFVLGGISEDVAKGIRRGLRQVPTITDVVAERIVETREAVTPGSGVVSDNEGSLGIVVWPAYVGVTDQWGAEPEGEYVRGQIGWGMDEHGAIMGHARILVPKGNYTHLVYFYHPTARMMIGHQQLSHPFNFTVEGVIDVDRITKNDFTQLPALNGYRLPV